MLVPQTESQAEFGNREYSRFAEMGLVLELYRQGEDLDSLQRDCCKFISVKAMHVRNRCEM